MADIAKAAGISRQAVYLHFASRTELLVATTHYVDLALGAEARLAAPRAARTGLEKLDRYIEAWSSYIPEIFGIAKALMASLDDDEGAATAWNDRMNAMREGCESAVTLLAKENRLNPYWSIAEATDLLWTMLSVPNWEQLTHARGWSNTQYVEHMQTAAHLLLLRDAD